MAAMWTFALARLAGILLLGLCLGLLIGPIWLWILGAACFYLAWQLLNLYRVDRWLRLRSQIDPPNIGGIWGDIIAQVIRLHRRKQYHKQRLVQLYRELRRSTAALPDGVIILSTQREIVWFNRQAARLLGLRRPVDVGLRIDNLIRAPEFAHYLHGDDFALPLVIRPPVQLDMFLALQMVPYGGGQSLLLVRDVTRQMRLEAMRKDFVANASHELRTPLTVISGYLDTLAEDPSVDPAWGGPIKDMRAQAQRMNAIIADLLELSRLESADGEAARDPIDVPRMLERLHRDALISPDRPRQVLLELDSSDGLYGSAHEIESAFTNLLVNAVKYTLAGGHGADALVDGRGGRLFLRHRQRHRNSRRAHSAADRALLPRRCGPLARAGRLRIGTRHRQARLAAPRRLARRAERRGQGQHLHLSFSAAAHLEAGDAERRERGSERMKVTNIMYTVDVRCNQM